MDFKNKYITWSKLETLTIQQIKEYLKAFQAKPDPFVKHNPSFLILGNSTYNLDDFEYDNYRLKAISDCIVVSESDFIELASSIEPKQLLTDYLKPKKLKDVIGHKSTIDSIKEWFQSTTKEMNGILLSGPPGIGKTTIAHLIPKSLGYYVQEFNASDCRSGNAVKELFSNCKKTYSLTKTCIIMDEIDGMSSGDKGGIVELAKIIKSSSIPFICIANERSSPKIKPILPVVLDLKMARPNKSTIASCLKSKLEPFGYIYDQSELEELCEKNGNDIRSIINQISFEQIIKLKSKTTTTKDSCHLLDPFSATTKLLNTKADIQTKASYVYFDSSLVPLMVQEVFTQTCEKSKKDLIELSNASDALSTFDLFDSYVHKKQNWSLLPDAVHCVVKAANHANGPPPFQMFPTFLGKTSKRNKHKRMLTDMSSSLNQSRNNLVLDSIDLLNIRLFEPFSKSKYEQKNITKVIEDLDCLNLTRDHMFETLTECSFVDYSKEIDSKIKSAFTREYNKTHTKDLKVSKETELSDPELNNDSEEYDDE